jgi:copper chaperone CopZ
MAYVIAVLAAVGIMIGIAMLPPGADQEAATTVQPSAKTVSSGRVLEEAGTVVFSVPAMHCEFSCYPRVKEALEQVPAVTEVQLAKQAEEGTIDNRQVVVKHTTGFDIDAAIQMLGQEGFQESELVQ